MSAEILRRAAALMRDRAEAATTHTPWQLLEDDDYAPPWTIASTHPEGNRTWVCKDARHTGEHIASWHPAVALLVAQSLSFMAQVWQDDHKCQNPFTSDEPCDACDNCVRTWSQEYALTLARTYLGEQQP